MKVLIAIASVCLTVSQLAPFAILPLAVELKANKIVKTREEMALEQLYPKETQYEKITGLESIINANVDDSLSYTTNQTLELDGYGTMGYNNQFFELIKTECTDTKKVLKYNDYKTRLTISYVTGLSSETDVPGYITQKLAGVNTATNNKHELLIGTSSWMEIQATDTVDNQLVRVYYLLSPDKDSAWWVRANIDPGYDSNKFDAILASMLKSQYVYYRGNSIFKTPTSGYYADKQDVIDDNTASGQDEYIKDGHEHKVYQNDIGFVTSTISDNWEDMEIILDGTLLHVPCTVNDLLSAGFVINDKSGVIGEDILARLATQDLVMTKGTTDITVAIKNDSASETKQIAQCRIFSIEVNVKGFKQTVGLPEDYVVIPGGITFNIYADKLLEYYGTPTSTEDFTGDDGTLCKRYTWAVGTKAMTIETGIVANITKVVISME